MFVRFAVRTSALLVAAAATLVAAAQERTPATVKVGDWVSYKMSAGPIANLTMKMTVTAKDDKEATLRVDTKFGDKDLPGKEQKIPLDQLTDPTKGFAGPSGPPTGRVQPKVESKKVEEADDTITVDGKKYECKRIKLKNTIDFAGKTIESVSTVWVSRDVPLSGMVKMESEVMGVKTVMELSGSGRGK
jgi:hypothetical protein